MSECAECDRRAKVISAQQEFIYKLKHDIRDFLVGDEPVVMQRSIADRGLRLVPPGSSDTV